MNSEKREDYSKHDPVTEFEEAGNDAPFEDYPKSQRGLRCMTRNQWEATEQREAKWKKMQGGLKNVKRDLRLNNPEEVENEHVIFWRSEQGGEILDIRVNELDIRCSILFHTPNRMTHKLIVNGEQVYKFIEKEVVEDLFKRYQDIAYDAEEENNLVRKIRGEYKERADEKRNSELVNLVCSKALGRLIYTTELIEQDDGSLEWVD